MNEIQFEEIQALRDRKILVPTVSVEDFPTHTHTLLYGYTAAERDTFHVYVDDIAIHRFIYRRGANYDDIRTVVYGAKLVWNLPDLLPTKRVYPERTSHAFALAVERAGMIEHLHLLPWDEERAQRVRTQTPGPLFGEVYNGQPSAYLPHDTSSRA